MTGLVLRRSLAVLARNLPAFLVLAFLVLAPVIVWAEAAGYPVTGLKGGKANAAVVRFAATAGVGALLLSGFLAGALTPAALATLDGRSLSFPRAIGRGVRALASAAGVAALAAMTVALGAAALVLPGLVLLGLLHVAVPAAVAEAPVPADASLRRSASLARRGWPALLAFALVPPAAAVGLALGLARLLIPHVAAGSARVPAPADWGRFVGLTLGLLVLFTAFAAVTAAVAYAELRARSDRNAPVP